MVHSRPRVVTRAPRKVVIHKPVRVYRDHHHSSFGLHLSLGSFLHFGYRHYPHHRPIIRIYGHYPILYPSYHHYYYGSYDPYYYGYYPYGTTRVYVPSTTVYVEKPVVVEAPTQVYESPQQNLISQVLRDDDTARLSAARELALYKNISSVAALVDVLINDSSPEVRATAAESLAQITDPAAYPALLRSATAEEDEETVRLAALAGADTIKAQTDESLLYVSPKMPPMNTGKPKLGEYLEDLRYGSREQREHAVKKLDDYRGTQSVAALINVLINDPVDEVREEAAETLGKLGDRMALPYLRWTRHNDPDKSVREDAKKAIEKIHNTIQ